MIPCVTTVTAKVTSGSTTNGTLAFDEHGREIGDRQRLPEQDAAVAPLAVQRVEAIEKPDDHGGEHEQHAPRKV